MLSNRLTRRRFVASFAVVASGIAAFGCTPATPAATPAPATAAPTTAAQGTQAPSQPKPAATAAATQAAKPAAGTPKKGGNFRIGRVQDILNFYPNQLSQGNEPMFFQVYDTLIGIGDGFKIEPRMAESWKFTPDYLKMTINLRKGVKFHSGREFVAKDVVETIKFYANKENASNILAFAVQLKSPKAIDNYTVEINFDQPLATIFDGLDLMFIIDPDNIADIRNKPNGTGPFMLDRWIPNQKTTFKRFDGYREAGMPYLDSFEVNVWPDAQALVVALETNAVDMAYPVSPLEAVRLKKDPKFQLSQDRFGLVFDVVMNTTFPPLTDRRVRQAVSWAIDRQRFCDTYLQGLSEPWSLPWPSFSPAYDEKLNKHYTYDPDKAKALLKEAGHEQGFSLKMLATKSRPGYTELAEQLQSDLSKVGIKITLDVQDEASWRPKHIGGDLEIATHTFGRNNKTPTSMFETAVVWRTDKNSASFYTDKFTSLVKNASASVDVEQAKKYWAELNQLIIDECFTLCIAPQPRPALFYNYVKGYRDNLDSYPILAGMWLDK